MTKEEIELFIEANGKGPKPINLVLWENNIPIVENKMDITKI